MAYEETSAFPVDTLQTPATVGLPTIVREAYDISEQAAVTPLSGGLVNETVLVNDEGDITVMRRLAPVLGAAVLEDARVVSDHLARNDWEAPVHLPTVSGEYSVLDNGNMVWHRMSYLASDGKTPALDSTLPAVAGNMLGRWHATTRSLEYTPQFVFPHFHDSPYHARKMQDYVRRMPDRESIVLADSLLATYNQVAGGPDTHKQVIHGDPKLDNMLFRDGKPFTLIDFDNIMLDTPWTDVGDLLRSVTGKLIQRGSVGNEIEDFVAAYHQAGELTDSVDEAAHKALLATGRIAVELGMRYLCDIADGNYFSWDPIAFRTRAENHASKASLQLAVAQHALRAS